ncbi:hypothetical protein C8R45DRAFT_933701 [Mycena sanguinolenta]|nr:hypothetical protein C8R45DRAFT_933701 [Mycena sanguinolenta]
MLTRRHPDQKPSTAVDRRHHFPPNLSADRRLEMNQRGGDEIVNAFSVHRACTPKPVPDWELPRILLPSIPPAAGTVDFVPITYSSRRVQAFLPGEFKVAGLIVTVLVASETDQEQGSRNSKAASKVTGVGEDKSSQLRGTAKYPRGAPFCLENITGLTPRFENHGNKFFLMRKIGPKRLNSSERHRQSDRIVVGAGPREEDGFSTKNVGPAVDAVEGLRVFVWQNTAPIRPAIKKMLTDSSVILPTRISLSTATPADHHDAAAGRPQNLASDLLAAAPSMLTDSTLSAVLLQQRFCTNPPTRVLGAA